MNNREILEMDEFSQEEFDPEVLEMLRELEEQEEL